MSRHLGSVLTLKGILQMRKSRAKNSRENLAAPCVRLVNGLRLLYSTIKGLSTRLVNRTKGQRQGEAAQRVLSQTAPALSYLIHTGIRWFVGTNGCEVTVH
jgi:hypothetical protein